MKDQKQLAGVDLLTGKPVYVDDDDPNAEACPKCGSKSLISDLPSIIRCLKCGWSDD